MDPVTDAYKDVMLELLKLLKKPTQPLQEILEFLEENLQREEFKIINKSEIDRLIQLFKVCTQVQSQNPTVPDMNKIMTELVNVAPQNGPHSGQAKDSEMLEDGDKRETEHPLDKYFEFNEHEAELWEQYLEKRKEEAKENPPNEESLAKMRKSKKYYL
jgi:hypothetical protein